MKLPVREFDAVVIGAGGAGMRAALQISQSGQTCALLSKVFPTRSHTVSAQGGITVALGNTHEDNWEWHMYDTVKGSDYIGDQDAIEYMCKTGPEAILELEHMGLPFSRLDDGRIYQRPFGGQSKNFGGEQAARTAAAADRTGHALLHTLYQQNLKNHTTIFSEWYALDLVKNQDGAVVGCTALCIETGEVVYFKARATVLATGGASKVYQYTTNPDISSGDGIAMAWRAGCRVANLEFNQFHPTALYHPQARNFLLTEALRGEGAYLKRPDGSRFMPDVDERGELAPRDIVARAIDHEMKRLGADCMFLDISHKPDDFIRQHFPMIYAKLLDLGMDLTKEPIPVVPAAHYTCGGVVVDDYGRTDVDGLYAIGEVSYTGLHGANRMASNSLLECLVYGWSAAIDIDRRMPSVHSVDVLPAWDESRVENADERVVIQHNWHELRLLMWDYVGIVRTTKRLERALRRITMLQQEIDEYYANFRVSNNLLELRNLVQVAELIVRCAMMRKESRGLHFTLDYPQQLAESGPSLLSPLTPHINR
ncbi:L-aspartate oxidase [Salmonella enterica subsp. enterica serovar Dublin]|nr:L-aspartate oxidase [Salmonella enterica subsp. enterica serovar Dublin]